MKHQKIYLLMVLTTIFWAGAFIAAKLSSPYIPVFTLTFLRFALATIILYFIIKIKYKKIYKPAKKDIPVFLFTGIIGMFGYHIFFFSSVKYTTAINSSIIGACNPIITTILCILFLKEKVNCKRLFGIILSFTGVFLTITNAKIDTIKNISLNKGDTLMLIAVLLWSTYMVYSKKISKNYTPIILTFYSFLVCTLFLIPFVIYESPLKYVNTIPYYSYIAIVYMSIFASVIGYLIQQMSIKEIGPGKTSVFNNLVPVFSIIFSIIILGESITTIKLFTTLLIITGVYICQKN